MLLMLLRVMLSADLVLNAPHFKSLCCVGYEDMLTGQDCHSENVLKAVLFLYILYIFVSFRNA